MPYRNPPSGTRPALFRIALALLFCGVLVLQCYFVSLPSPLEVAQYPWFAQRGQEMVLAFPSPDPFLLSHDGYPNEYVDVIFEKARLDPDTLVNLKRLGFAVSNAPAEIKYVTRVEGAPDPKKATGKTSIEVKLTEAGREPSLLHLFQVGTEDQPYLEMTSEGAKLRIALYAATPENGDDLAPGCQKELWVGGRRFRINTMPVTIVAEPNSNVRFLFYPFQEQSPLWGADNPFRPFTVGRATVRPGDLPGFPLSEFGVRPIASEGAPMLPYLYLIRGLSQKEPSLRMEGLTISLDNRIQAQVTGRGWISGDKNHKLIRESVSLPARLRNHLPLAVLFVGMDALLLFSFPRLRSRSTSRKPLGSQEGGLQQLLLPTVPEPEPFLADLRERMTERLSRSELGTVWFDLLQTSMENDMTGNPHAECVIELLTQVQHRNLLPRLLEELRHTYPHVLNP